MATTPQDVVLTPRPTGPKIRDMNRTALADYLRSAREQSGLTQEQVARAADRSKTWVVDLERGRAAISDLSTLVKLAAILQVNPGELILIALVGKQLKSPLELSSAASSFADELIGMVGAAQGEEVQQVQPRSYKSLEEHAEGLATKLFGRAVEDGTWIPVCSAVTRSQDVAQAAGLDRTLRFVILGASPDDPEGSTYTENGDLVMAFRKDVWERAEEGDGRARFTLAHELAHSLLHNRELSEHGRVAFRDQFCTPSQKLRPGQPIYTSPEYQANTWSGCFLMPERAVRRFVARENERHQECTIDALAQNFMVSPTVARIRLEKLLPRLLGQPRGGEVNP